MGNRADRRAEKKNRPKWQKLTSDQRINAMCKNGITPRDVDDAYAQGRKDAVDHLSDYITKDCYAAFLLAAHEVFGFGHKRCLRLLRAADDRIVNSLASDEAVAEVFKTVGVRLNFLDPKRIIDALEED